MRSVFNVLLLLAFFHGGAFADSATPCADALFSHLDSDQRFTGLGHLAPALERRESATLLIKMLPNNTRASLTEMTNLGLSDDLGVRLLSEFTVFVRGEFYYVVTGTSADLLEAAKTLQDRYNRASLSFQILGSRTTTRSFQISVPRNILEIQPTPEGRQTLEDMLAKEENARYGLYIEAENAQQLVFVISKDELNGISAEIFQKLQIATFHVPPKTKLAEYLTQHASRLRDRAMVEYGEHVVLSQTALFALKQLAGEPIPEVASTDVKVHDSLARELAKCERPVCVVPTPRSLLQGPVALAPAAPVEAAKPVEAVKPVEAAKPVEAVKPVEAMKPVEAVKPVEAAKPAAAPAAVAKPLYPIFAQAPLTSPEISPILEVMKEFGGGLSLIGNVKPIFIRLLDRLDPSAHAEHERQVDAIEFAGSDTNNARVKGAAQNRLLAAWRILTDALLGTHEPRRTFDAAAIKSIAEAYAARVTEVREAKAAPPAAATPTPPAATPERATSAPEQTAAAITAPEPVRSPVRIDLKALEFKASDWTLKRRGEFVFAPERREGVWSRRPIGMITQWDSPYFVFVQMYHVESVSMSTALEQVARETRVEISPNMRARAALADLEIVPIDATLGQHGSKKLAALNEANKPFLLVPKADLNKPAAQQHRILAIPVKFDPEGRIVVPSAPVVPRAEAPPAPTANSAAPTAQDAMLSLEGFVRRNIEYALPDGETRYKMVFNDKGRSKQITFRIGDDGALLQRQISFIEPDVEKKFWEQVGREHGFEATKQEFSPSKLLLEGKPFTSASLASGVVARLRVKHELEAEEIARIIGGLEKLESNGNGSLTGQVVVGDRGFVITGVAQDKRLIVLDIKIAY